MSIVKHAVIAAAGLGSRLGLGMPKCLVQIEGKPILKWQLDLLRDVEDVRIVVGFQEADVIAEALKIRNDITFVRNPGFRSNTTMDSYKIGCSHISENCLFMDSDIVFESNTFHSFVKKCEDTNFLIGITPAKTQDAVFVKTQGDQLTSFSRDEVGEFEWANLLWINPSVLTPNGGTVYGHLNTLLPAPYSIINSFEVDRETDLDRAVAAVKSWGIK